MAASRRYARPPRFPRPHRRVARDQADCECRGRRRRPASGGQKISQCTAAAALAEQLSRDEARQRMRTRSTRSPPSRARPRAGTAAASSAKRLDDRGGRPARDGRARPGPPDPLVAWRGGARSRRAGARGTGRPRAIARAIAPGYGHSPEAATVDTVDDLAYLYLDLLAQQKARDAVVIGASLGGWIAAEMAVKSTTSLGHLVLVAPLGIKVGDRETRDIPDIFALHPDEVLKLQYYDPAWHGLDPADAVRRSADGDRAQSRSHRALRLGAVLPQSKAARTAAPHHAADALAVGRGRSLRRRRLLRLGVSATPSRAPGSKRSPRPGTFRTSSSRLRWSSASERSSRRDDTRASRADARHREEVGHARLVLQRERVPPAARSAGVRLDPGQASQPLLRSQARRRPLSPLHRRVDDGRGSGARDHGERAPPDGDQRELRRPPS